MPSTATITAKAGPGNTVTALALTGVTEFKFQAGPVRPMLFVTCDQGIREFDINASTTLTCTLTAGGNAAFVVS
jgi:hypothetical protein